MAKFDANALKKTGLFTDEQIAALQTMATAKAPVSAKCTIQDYTTTTGNRYKALNVKAARVFVKVSDAENVIKALQEGLARAQAGEVDEVKAAKGKVEE